MIRFEDILDKIESYKPHFDEELLQKAYIFTALEHKGQVRRSGDPYLVHPLNVAFILTEMQLDEVSIAVGLLHDVLEDTLTTKERLTRLFGSEIAELVDGVTKISRYEYVSQEHQQAETFRKMILAMSTDLRVILVKLADRLHNMRTLQFLPEDRRRMIAKETAEIYAPIANRLGMGLVKSELQDLAFRHLNPKEHDEVRAAVEAKMSVSAAMVERIRTTLAEKMAENGIEVEVGGRVKAIHSIHEKLGRQGIDIGGLYDYLAFRIIVRDVKDCYAALGIIHQTWRPVPGRFKDYIAMPKPNFYQALHTTVVAPRGQPFEVQIRTREMDLVAEQGIAAHWKYKEGRLGSAEDANFLWLRQVVEWQKEVTDPRAFLHFLKLDLYPDEIYTFTPRGDVLAFPRGATPLDFAYRVHTDVGNHCVGARVNGKLVPLRTQLRSGDIVEILTSQNQVPNREWLNLAQTSRARHKIRHWLNTEQKEQSIELGRRLLEKEAKRVRAQFKKLVASGAFDPIVVEHGLSKLDELFAGVGYGKLSARSLIERVVPGVRKDQAAPDKGGALKQAVRKMFPFGEAPAIQVGGTDDLMTYLARCCSPVPGEEITGYITRGKGVAVHSANCPNVRNLMYNPDREIEVRWSGGQEADYRIELEIEVEERPGILARAVSSIANLKTNIRHIESRMEDGRGTVAVTIEIPDVKQLEKVIRSLSAIDGVVRVERKFNIRQASA